MESVLATRYSKNFIFRDVLFDIASPPHPWDEDLREDSPFPTLSSSPLLPVGCCEEFAPSPIQLVELLPAYLVGTARPTLIEFSNSVGTGLANHWETMFIWCWFFLWLTPALMTFLTRPEHQDLLLLISYLKRLAWPQTESFSLGIPSGMTRRTSFSSTSKDEEPHSLIDSETGLQSHSRKHWPLKLLLLSFLVTEIKLSVKRVQLVLVLASQTDTGWRKDGMAD